MAHWCEKTKQDGQNNYDIKQNLGVSAYMQNDVLRENRKVIKYTIAAFSEPLWKVLNGAYRSEQC